MNILEGMTRSGRHPPVLRRADRHRSPDPVRELDVDDVCEISSRGPVLREALRRFDKSSLIHAGHGTINADVIIGK